MYQYSVNAKRLRAEGKKNEPCFFAAAIKNWKVDNGDEYYEDRRQLR